MTTGSALSLRADVARLALQLRATHRDVAAAEAAEASVDPKTARAELRSKLEPLIEARRRSLSDAVERARAEAAATVAAAQHQAVIEPAPTPVTVAPAADAAEVAVVAHYAWPPPVAAPVPPPVADQTPALPQPITVEIDAEIFARVFATVFASVLDERLAAWRASVPATPAPRPAKPRVELRNALHLDVILAGFAALIVLVIILAWIG